MIAIIDYGVGNINAFANIYKRLNANLKVVKTSGDLAGVTKIILPGVGAFDHAMGHLNESGMRGDIDRLVRDEKVPIIGVCVGMQLLARCSDEGVLPGLGYIGGVVKKFDNSSKRVRLNLPHMGWNDVIPRKGEGLFDGIEGGHLFYFLHSYYFQCDKSEDVIATSEYGCEFASAIRHDNVYGVQFHPEKSHRCGVQLLQNFFNI